MSVNRGSLIPARIISLLGEAPVTLEIDRLGAQWEVILNQFMYGKSSREIAWGRGRTLPAAFRDLLVDLDVQTEKDAKEKESK